MILLQTLITLQVLLEPAMSDKMKENEMAVKKINMIDINVCCRVYSLCYNISRFE